MEDDDFEDWTVCQLVNECFYEQPSIPRLCILCSSVTRPDDGRCLSTFWKLTSCWGGHDQGPSAPEEPAEIEPGVCAACDLYFVLNVVKGTLQCRREGCRRSIRLNVARFKKNVVLTGLKLYQYVANTWFTLGENANNRA
jgi:hypothetical protein